MKPFVPARVEFLLFGFLVSGMMSLLVSGVAMLRTVGMVSGFFGVWMSAWLPSWAVAFVAILFVVPVVRRLIAKCVIRN